jgi:apolipoprotein N-acyltransferase
MASAARYMPKVGTLASTACIVLAVPPVQWSALIWVGLVPWLFSLRRCATTFEAVVQGFWLNLLLGFGGTFWVAHATARYLSVSISVGMLALIGHSLVHQLQLVVFGGLYWKTSRGAPPATFGSLLMVACVYVGLDWLTPKIFQDTLGVLLWSSGTLRQLAAWGGAMLLTFVILVVNLAVYASVAAMLDARRAVPGATARLARGGLWLFVSLAAFVSLGALEEARVRDAMTASRRILRVGLVQGSVSEDLKRRSARGDPEAARATLDTYVRGTRRLLDSPNPPALVLWPETAYPGVFRKPESDAQLHLNVAFDRFIADAGVPIAFGAYDREDRSDRRVLRNAVYLVSPTPGQQKGQLSPMQTYHKSILFPVGEYFPFFEETTVRQWLPHSAHLASGEGPRVLELLRPGEEPLRLGPSICYEDVFASHAQALARSKADLLLNVSNDSWFGDDGAAQWHLMMASLRSIETGLPQVRATNSGYSAFILPNGELHEVTGFGEETVRAFDLPMPRLGTTLRSRLGDWFGPFSMAVATLGLLAGRLRRRDGSA